MPRYDSAFTGFDFRSVLTAVFQKIFEGAQRCPADVMLDPLGIALGNVFVDPERQKKRQNRAMARAAGLCQFITRFGSLHDFTRNVIVNEFGGAEPMPFMLDALVAYMQEFDFLPNSMLTAQGELTDLASEAAHRGEEVFNRPFAQMDGNSCASCHIPSANFLDRKAHDIGSVHPAYEGARAGALDTPTLLSSVYSAPYFHDGSLPTLASVVDWFDTTKELGLSEQERGDLTVYLETVGSGDEPFEVFDDRHTPFRLAFEELTTFASTLDTLLPKHDSYHILVLTDTVAADLAADASTMSNLAERPGIYRMAELLSAVGQAVRDEDWKAAETHWSDFKAVSMEIDERVY